MAHILAIGSPPAYMVEALGVQHTVHAGDDVDALVEEHGALIEAVVVAFGGVSADLIARLPSLRIIANHGVGYERVAVDAAVERRIVVTHTPDVLNDDVADMAVLLLLAVCRSLIVDDRWARSGTWVEKGTAPLRRSIHGLNVGIVGLGRIGGTVARRLEAFGCSIAYHNRSKKDVGYRYFDDLTEMAAASDALVIVLPGTEETYHLVDAAVLDALGPKGIVVNIGRGPVIDEGALVAALRDGRIGGAGLDVFENEPDVPDALKAMDNVVMTPHSAGATVETRRAMAELVVGNVLDFLSDGTVRTPVPEVRSFAKTRG